MGSLWAPAELRIALGDIPGALASRPESWWYPQTHRRMCNPGWHPGPPREGGSPHYIRKLSFQSNSHSDATFFSMSCKLEFDPRSPLHGFQSRAFLCSSLFCAGPSPVLGIEWALNNTNDGGCWKVAEMQPQAPLAHAWESPHMLSGIM